MINGTTNTPTCTSSTSVALAVVYVAVPWNIAHRAAGKASYVATSAPPRAYFPQLSFLLIFSWTWPDNYVTLVLLLLFVAFITCNGLLVVNIDPGADQGNFKLHKKRLASPETTANGDTRQVVDEKVSATDEVDQVGKVVVVYNHEYQETFKEAEE